MMNYIFCLVLQTSLYTESVRQRVRQHVYALTLPHDFIFFID